MFENREECIFVASQIRTFRHSTFASIFLLPLSLTMTRVASKQARKKQAEAREWFKQSAPFMAAALLALSSLYCYRETFTSAARLIVPVNTFSLRELWTSYESTTAAPSTTDPRWFVLRGELLDVVQHPPRTCANDSLSSEFPNLTYSTAALQLVEHTHEPALQAVGLWALARCLGSHASFAQVGPDALTETQLYAAAIERDGSFCWAYSSLGWHMEVHESVTVAGISRNKKDLFVEALRCDSKDAYSYVNLGRLLKGSETIALADGSVLDKRALFATALQHDPTFPPAYNNLGLDMQAHEEITLGDGRVMNRQGLFLEALRFQPDNAMLHHNLAATIDGDGTLLLPGRDKPMSKRELLIEAIRLSPDYSIAYLSLGYTMGDTETISLPPPHAGRWTSARLFKEALRHDPNYAYAWISLGWLLQANQTTVLANGRTMNQQQLFVEAVRSSPNYAYGWNNLGAVMVDGSSVQLADGRVLTKAAVFLEAIRSDHNDSFGYSNLAVTLQPGTTATLDDGRVLTQQQLYLEALRCDITNSMAFNGLGLTLEDEETTVALPDGRVLGKRALFEAALELDPNNTYALHNLEDLDA